MCSNLGKLALCDAIKVLMSRAYLEEYIEGHVHETRKQGGGMEEEPKTLRADGAF